MSERRNQHIQGGGGHRQAWPRLAHTVTGSVHGGWQEAHAWLCPSPGLGGPLSSAGPFVLGCLCLSVFVSPGTAASWTPGASWALGTGPTVCSPTSCPEPPQAPNTHFPFPTGADSPSCPEGRGVMSLQLCTPRPREGGGGWAGAGPRGQAGGEGRGRAAEWAGPGGSADQEAKACRGGEASARGRAPWLPGQEGILAGAALTRSESLSASLGWHLGPGPSVTVVELSCA